MLASWTAPSEGTVFGVVECNAEPLCEFIEAFNKKTGAKISVTTIIIKALGLSFREAPGLNCRLVGNKFIPHKTIDISCLVALEDGKDLASAKLLECDKASLVDIQARLIAKAEKLRKREDKDFEASKPMLTLLPVPLIRWIVHTLGELSGSWGLELVSLGVRPYLFGSAMVTSVGMLGVEQAFVPFTPWAHVPLLVMVGAITPKAIVEEGKIVARRRIGLTCTLDHRFVDGTEAARLSRRMRHLVEHPWELVEEAQRAEFAPPTAPLAS